MPEMMKISEQKEIDDEDIAIDPVCGMKVDKKTGIKRNIEGKPFYFCSRACADSFEKAVKEKGLKAVEKKTKKRYSGMPEEGKVSDEYAAIDPVCGMKVDKRKAISRQISGRKYYFCTESCAKTFEDPEKELQDMKKRVSVAIVGVVLVGVFRLG
ncbi:MAG: YHS domain-containing protein, partial [Promethearchaeota archaeon]